MKNYEEQTQKYSTFGDKLLQHPLRLARIKIKKEWRPITVQLCPTAICDFNCEFCSVKNRDRSLFLPWKWIKKGLKDFKDLGAKGLEISGGGNPLLYPEINRLIIYAADLGYDIGIISNSPNPGRYLSEAAVERIKWYRSSLSGFDNNIPNLKYDFSIIPEGKLGFSYIVNSKTTIEKLKKIVQLVKERPDVKFVRVAPNCLEADAIKNFKDKWGDIIDKLDTTGKFFIKEIGDNYKPYPNFCGVGLVRPYCAEDGYVYICSSFVLENRKLEPQYRLGHLSQIKKIYRDANREHKLKGIPYKIDINDCMHCFYANNNKLLESITKELPDKNFA